MLSKTGLSRAPDAQQAFHGLERISVAASRGFRDEIANVSKLQLTVAADAVQTMTFADFCRDYGNETTVCKFGTTPFKSGAIVVLKTGFIVQLVDKFYGGSGDHAGSDREFTAAERRFLGRFARSLGKSLEAAWGDPSTIGFECLEYGVDLGQAGFANGNDLIVVQTLNVSGTPFSPSVIQIVYLHQDLAAHPQATGNAASAPSKDPDLAWQAALRDALLQAHLPLRTIFARTELPLSTLLTLNVGDFIPIHLPKYVPVTVGGRLFAEAIVGDTDGLASIRIEKLMEGY